MSSFPFQVIPLLVLTPTLWPSCFQPSWDHLLPIPSRNFDPWLKQQDFVSCSSQRVIRTHYLHCEIKKLIHKKFVKCCLPVPSIVNAHFMEKDYVFSKAMHRHGLTRHLAGSLRVYIRRIWTFLNYMQSETAEVIVGISMLSFFFFLVVKRLLKG